MADLTVDPRYLEKLATNQDEAAGKAAEAAAVTSEIGHKVNVSHGVISTASNDGFASTEVSRRNAGLALQQASDDLAAKLRATEETYVDVDEELGENLGQQMLDPDA